MILHARTPERVVCVSQTSHAWLSGQLARAWGNADFARPEPWEDVCLAIEQHDVGMAEWDLRPALDPATGHPLEFLRMTEQIHVALWAAAPGKVMAASPYAALLVSMHGTSLMRHREPTPLVQQYIAAQERLQERLLDELDEDRVRVIDNRQLLWALDHLSLVLLVDGWSPADVTAPGRRPLTAEVVGPGRAIVDPWPFAVDHLEVCCHGRVLEGTFDDEGQLHQALDAAAWQLLSFTLTPG